MSIASHGREEFTYRRGELCPNIGGDPVGFSLLPSSLPFDLYSCN